MSQKENLTQVIVKFHDDIDLPYEDGVERHIPNKLTLFHPQSDTELENFTFERLFRSLPSDKIKDLLSKGQEKDPNVITPNLLSYFKIKCPDRIDPKELVNHLSNWEIVQTAYVDTPATEPQTVDPSDDPLFVNQGYLRPAPEGIDVEYGWKFPGGDGTGQSVIDVERGWTLNHEDLIHLQAQLLFGNIRDESRWHGTAVLGEIAAKDSQIGCIGIVPNIKSVNVVSYHGTGEHDAILSAIPHLEPGNVLILEIQTTIEGQTLPIEVKPAVLDTIRLAIQHGIIVIEAAGNGGIDLDLYEVDSKNIFNRSSMDFQDSGAIMVGASSGVYPHKRMNFTNHGSRIDCYAWGERVTTCYSDSQGDTKKYNYNFNGTSSATPIVAGAVLAVQGIVQAFRGNRLSPTEIKNILTDSSLGTPSANPMTDRIGVMPNLRAIINFLVNN